MKELGPHEQPVPIVQSAHSLGELASVIRSSHKVYVATGRAALERAKETGEFLRKAKFMCRPGEWLPWLKEHLSDITIRSAQIYMRVAANWSRCADSAHLDDALKMLTDDTEDEHEEEPASLEGKTWRSLPLREFLDVADYVWVNMEQHKIVTAGELYARLRDGASLGFLGGDLKDALDQVESIPGFVKPPKGPGGGNGSGGRPTREAIAARQGQVKFDWLTYESAMGRIIRGVDDLCKAYPEEQTSPERLAADRLLEEYTKLVKQWKKKVNKLDKE